VGYGGAYRVCRGERNTCKVNISCFWKIKTKLL
jgi:hypothetical protein